MFFSGFLFYLCTWHRRTGVFWELSKPADEKKIKEKNNPLFYTMEDEVRPLLVVDQPPTTTTDQVTFYSNTFPLLKMWISC